MEILPLTPGLLASAMLRHDHGVFAPYSDDPIGRLLGTPEQRIPKVIDRVLASYDEAASGNLADVQLLEEFTGSGFYRPDKEEGYVRTLDQHPGMLAIALDRLASRNI